jgi:APA family basic amino acid/polyamine antiporter
METIKRDIVPARLGLWDATSIILGIIIGVGIFKTPPDVFASVPGFFWVMMVWLLGGLLALAGALCFAELASTYPRSGGEYVYLTRAYGPLVGYLFAWAQLAVIRPGSMGAMAYVFADFAARTWGLDGSAVLWLAIAAVVVLTLVNVLGVTLGTTTQNLFTVAKVLGLVAIVVAGLGWGQSAATASVPITDLQAGSFATAMIFVLWTYAGWNEAAYVASEVKNPQRNIPKALILGTMAVMSIYLLINFALWYALGADGARAPSAVSDVIAGVFPTFGAAAFRVLVMISALGALNGMIFTTARIYSEFGADHRLFQPLSHWSKRMGTPVRALGLQCLISLILIGVIELMVKGQDAAFFAPLATFSKDPFERMVEVTAAVFWMFFFLTGVALFILREKDPGLERPFKVPFYPWLPLLFCASCAYMVYGCISHKPEPSLVGLLILAGGLPFYFWRKKTRRPALKLETREPVAHAGQGS